MKKCLLMVMILMIVLISAGCAPPPPGMSAPNSDETSNSMESIIESLDSQLGEPPENVIGFGAGYKSKDPITPSENAALRILFQSKSRHFAYYTMGCVPTTMADDMENYDPDSASDPKTGYGTGNSTWVGKAGFNQYDRLGNLDARIQKTEYTIVSIDKTTKKASTETAQAEIDRGSIYAYWIVSLPDDNTLDGVVYNTGADDILEPVKKGILHFKRVGPGPASVDIKVNVDGNGYYKSEGELTAGHYEVSFNPEDGKGEKVLNENWLYIPGDTPTKDWKVLVRETYQIIYDQSHTMISDGVKAFETHMEWHDIPIDWTVESDEALALGTQLGHMGMYCLTYAYYDQIEMTTESPDDTDDESETESTPGYSPTVLTEYAPSGDSGTAKITRQPTLSFFRGAKDGIYKEDGLYMNLEYGVSMVWEGPPIDIPLGFEIIPVPYASEAVFEKQGWGLLSRIARLDEKAVSALINNGTPLTIIYEDAPPTIKRIKIVIKPED